MHDGISLEQQGIPTASIITDVFLPTARAYTRLMGVPDFPYLHCPHPIANASGEQLQQKAEELAGQVERLLLEGRV